jgi:hypothetical protein
MYFKENIYSMQKEKYCIFVQKNSGHLGYNFRFVERKSLNGIDSEQEIWQWAGE